MAEQVKRTIGNKSGPKIGAKKPEAAPAKEETTVEEPRKKGGVKKLILLGVAGLVFMGAGVGAAVLLLQPDAAPAAAAGEVAAEPVEHVELGDVVPVEPVSVNLAGNRYLRLGFALQLSADAGHAPDVNRARDIGIATFSGREMAQVNDTANRDAMKAEFLAKLQEAFGVETVVDVYYTDFVTQ